MEKRLLFYHLPWGLALLLFSLGAHAQNATLTIDAPASIAGSYDVQYAGFGPSICALDMPSGNFDIVVDGAGGTLACDEVTNDLAGRIAIIDRGTCNFSLKVIHAQEAGAIAVLVVNNVADDTYITMAPGDRAEEVTIPSFFITQSEGESLKNEVANGLSGSFRRNDFVDEFMGEVVYYEDFNGGFNGWTSRGVFCSNGVGAENAQWVYEPEGTIFSACYGPQTYIMPSPTRCNGVLVFNSGIYDNAGNCDDAGSGVGDCPAPQVVELTSPVIDLSGTDAVSYSLRFHQLTAQFNSIYLAAWSFDGGTSWDTTAINTELNTFDFNPQAAISVPLPGSGEADSVVVQLLYQGNYYFWGIDDVQIIAQEANNLRVNNDFYAIPANAQVPLSQVEPISFLADIENVGAITQPNTRLNVSIFNQDGLSVFNETLPYGNVPGNTLVENVPFGATYTPLDTGTYLGTYEIISDSMDFDFSNNQQFFNFRVTDNLFAKEFGATREILPAPQNWSANEVYSWAYGNYFFVPNGDGQFIQTVQFALGDPVNDAGQSIAISIYEWAEDLNNDMVADRNELNQVGFDIYTITGTEEFGEIIEVPYPQFDDPIALKNNMAYIVALEYYASDQTTVAFAASEQFDYNATVFLSGIQAMPRYAGMVAVEGDLSVANFVSTGFGRDIVPVVRMTVGDEPVTHTKERPLDLSAQLAISPNPSRGSAQLYLNFKKMTGNVMVEVFDSKGRLQWYSQLDNAQQNTVDVPVTSFTSGLHVIRVTTAEGTGVKRFIYIQP